MTKSVSASVDEELKKYRDPDKRVRFEYGRGKEDKNDKDMAASTSFGWKGRI